MSDPPAPAGLELVREPWPPVAGRPGLAQGRYGAEGNLELVVPAVDDGIWVGWFNLDPHETWSGAAVGAWSGALKFAGGHRYVSADVTQVDAGPDFLEVIALTTHGVVRRHVWSPGPGFVDHGELARSVASCAALVQGADGTLSLDLTRRDGSALVLTATPTGSYPQLRFDEAAHPEEVSPPRRPAAHPAGHPDGHPARHPVEGADATAGAEVRVGGRTERHVVARREDQLWHRIEHQTTAGAGAGAPAETRLVEAHIWRR